MSLHSQLLPITVVTAATTQRRLTIRSLTIVLLSNLIWPAIIIFLFPSSKNYESLPKPIWFPSISTIHLGTLGSAFFMGLAGWIIWAEYGIEAHKAEYYSNARPIYISQISTGVMWHPVVLGIGSAKLGWVVSLAGFGSLYACYENFRKINLIAGVLVTPALAWSIYLSLVSCQLIYL